MVARTTAVASEHTKTMSFIHHNACVVLLLQFNDFGEFSQVTFHGEETVCNNQLDGLWTTALQLFLKIGHVVVFVMIEG